MMKQRSYSLKLRSWRVVGDSSAVVPAAEGSGGGGGGGEGESKQSCWADMPPELLREILKKVEEAEPKWPMRRHVVACAGVCRTWREAMKEVVQAPEVSGNITFPLSVKQPGPRGSLLQCFIKRNRTTQTYRLYLNLTQALSDDGKFLLAARKSKRPTCTDYYISLHPHDMSKGGATRMGKLRSNFIGTKFIVYDSLVPIAEPKMAKSRSMRLMGAKQVPYFNYPVAQISYELNVLGTRGPRRMQCIMDAIPSSAIKPGNKVPVPINPNDSSPALPFFRSRSSSRLERTVSEQSEIKGGGGGGALVLRNKAPRWHQELQCWCLNFHSRVTVASVKNFQLVASPEKGETGPEYERIILQFGKVGKDVFTMDYRYPLSAFQAFAICLSSFDTKIACE